MNGAEVQARGKSVYTQLRRIRKASSKKRKLYLVLQLGILILKDQKVKALKLYLIHMSVPWTHSNIGVITGLCS